MKIGIGQTVCSECHISLFGDFIADLGTVVFVHPESECPNSEKRFKMPLIEVEEV